MKLDKIFPIIAPFSYIPSIFIKYILERILNPIPNSDAKTGTLLFPSPCKIEFKVWFSIENIIPKEYNILVVPITGNYAYNIFVGDYNKTFSSTAYSIDGGGLEQFFEAIKNK